ncbi:MAG: DegT/DnrJ/EryC1/StrS family aminotransferase [bacterium]|nr:DegT/DnrJ/EryC1/StrS family aminotransferase [bacterium]
MIVPVNESVISEEAKKNVAESLRTGWLSSAGPFVKQFEENFASYFGTKHAVTLTNGGAALHIALLALGIGRGDEVIVPAFTMAAPWFAVMYTGATPVFVDCELDTFNIDPKKIEAKITPKTKAIIPVHIYGHACEMDSILAIAKKHNLRVIEDAAEAHGGEYEKKLCGTMGDFGAFSFYANKIISTGEGGMLITNDDTWAEHARQLKTYSFSKAKRFIHDEIGYNYRLGNLQAAVGCGELSNLPNYLKHKEHMAKTYERGLADITGLRLPITKPGVKNVYWMYAVLVDEKKFGMNRDTLRIKLKEKGIDTRDFFYPPEEQPVLKNIIGLEKFPNAAFAGKNGLYLPSGLAITEKQLDYVIGTIRAIAKS